MTRADFQLQAPFAPAGDQPRAIAELTAGLERGDRVGLQLPNTVDFPIAYFGVLRAGLVAVPLNPGYTAAELAHALGDSGARALVTATTTAAVAESAAADLAALEHVLVAHQHAGPVPEQVGELADPHAVGVEHRDVGHQPRGHQGGLRAHNPAADHHDLGRGDAARNGIHARGRDGRRLQSMARSGSPARAAR